MQNPLNDPPDAPHWSRDAATTPAYLVSGSTGAYEMSHTWPVAIVPTQVEADALRAAAQAVADQVFSDGQDNFLDLLDFAHDLNPFDPAMHFIDDTQVHYSVTHVPSLANLPSLQSALSTVRALFLARRSSSPAIDES